MATIVLELTEAEAKAVYGWAGAAAVGFHFGPDPLPDDDPGVSALAKVEKALGIEPVVEPETETTGE